MRKTHTKRLLCMEIQLQLSAQSKPDLPNLMSSGLGFGVIPWHTELITGCRDILTSESRQIKSELLVLLGKIIHPTFF